MTDHIIGYGKKVITDSSGTLYSSGGPDGPYNAYEEDYFIIRRTSAEYAAASYFILSFTMWDVADYSVATTKYDYIDVYRQNSTAYDPSDWVWIERIGGADLNGAAVFATTYYLDARNIKFVFRSKHRQDYTYYGFKLDFSTNSVFAGTNLDTIASTTYTDETNLKENAGDSASIVLSNIDQDPGKTNWNFIPAGQFDSEEGSNLINILNYEFTNLNYSASPVKIPLSYTQSERSTTRKNSTNTSNIRKGREWN